MVGENNNNNSKQNNFKYYNKSACATSGSSNSSPKSRRIRNQTYFHPSSQSASQPAMQAWSPNHTTNYTFTEPLPSPAPITIYSICRLQSYIIWGRFVFHDFLSFFLNWEKIFDYEKSWSKPCATSMETKSKLLHRDLYQPTNQKGDSGGGGGGHMYKGPLNEQTDRRTDALLEEQRMSLRLNV